MNTLKEYYGSKIGSTFQQDIFILGVRDFVWLRIRSSGGLLCGHCHKTPVCTE